MEIPVSERELFFDVFVRQKQRKGQTEVEKISFFEDDSNQEIASLDLGDYRPGLTGRQRLPFPQEFQGENVRIEFAWEGTMPSTRWEYSTRSVGVWLIPEPTGNLVMLPAGLGLLAVRRRR